MRHYRIEKGTPCATRKAGATEWVSFTTTKRLWFAQREERAGEKLWVFLFDPWEVRVDPDHVGGAAVTPIPDGPHCAPKSDPTVRLTRELLHAGIASLAGFNEAQSALLGIDWPPEQGCLSDQIGREIPVQAYERYLALKDAGHRRVRRKKKSKT